MCNKTRTQRQQQQPLYIRGVDYSLDASLLFPLVLLSVCDATHLSRPLGTGSSFFELFELPLILFSFFSGSSPLVVLVILLSLEESMLQKLCCHVLCIIYYVDFKRERERVIPKFHAISFVHFLFCRVQLPIAGRLERNVVPVGSQHGAHQ